MPHLLPSILAYHSHSFFSFCLCGIGGFHRVSHSSMFFRSRIICTPLGEAGVFLGCSHLVQPLLCALFLQNCSAAFPTHYVTIRYICMFSVSSSILSCDVMWAVTNTWGPILSCQPSSTASALLKGGVSLVPLN